ncbi:hypothetical protein OEZ82_27395, partial [Leclercia adecarboxylata]|uniref:hypothetical protein n=1 Tax=Leclercia adecarboxylata TaxID=83655 RepID=UPI00234C973A
MYKSQAQHDDQACLRQLWALRPQLPEARLVIVLRDPRDMLLEWIAFSAPAPPAGTSVHEAAEWLARALAPVAPLPEQSPSPGSYAPLTLPTNPPPLNYVEPSRPT